LDLTNTYRKKIFNVIIIIDICRAGKGLSVTPTSATVMVRGKNTLSHPGLRKEEMDQSDEESGIWITF
jgi:hypothetical protein